MSGRNNRIIPLPTKGIPGAESYLMNYFDNMKAKFADKGIPFLMEVYGAYRRTTPKDFAIHNDAVDYWITFNTKQAPARKYPRK